MPIIEIKSVKKACDLLKKGELLVYPTETAYALGASALNQSAVEKIYEVKGRNNKKPLAVIAGDLMQAKKFFLFNKMALELANKYWPGPVTLILPVKNKKLKSLNQASKSVGVRVSSDKIAQKISKTIGKPIVSTSANISGKSTPYSERAIYKYLDKQPIPVYFLSAGTLPRRATSAVVDANDDIIKIIRFNSVLKK